MKAPEIIRKKSIYQQFIEMIQLLCKFENTQRSNQPVTTQTMIHVKKMERRKYSPLNVANIPEAST